MRNGPSRLPVKLLEEPQRNPNAGTGIQYTRFPAESQGGISIHEKPYQSKEWMCEQLQTAFDIVKDVKDHMLGSDAEPLKGFSRLWNKLDTVCGEIESAINAISRKDN